MYTPWTDRLQDVRYGEISAGLGGPPPSCHALAVFTQFISIARREEAEGSAIGRYGDVTWRRQRSGRAGTGFIGSLLDRVTRSGTRSARRPSRPGYRPGVAVAPGASTCHLGRLAATRSRCRCGGIPGPLAALVVRDLAPVGGSGRLTDVQNRQRVELLTCTGAANGGNSWLRCGSWRSGGGPGRSWGPLYPGGGSSRKTYYYRQTRQPACVVIVQELAGPFGNRRLMMSETRASGSSRDLVADMERM